MNRDVIFHNPRCSKSRQTLDIVTKKGITLEVIEYLKSPPSKEELQFVCSQLDIPAVKLIRVKEDLFKELGLSVDDRRSDGEWFDIMIKHPVLIERPIIIYRRKAALGRPPENVLEIIGK